MAARCWIALCCLAALPTAAAAQSVHVVNRAHISQRALLQAEAATQREANTQLRPRWHTPSITFGRSGWVVTLYAGQSPYVHGPYAFHSGGGRDNAAPYAKVWAVSPLPWQHNLAHEVMEMLVNPRLTTRINGMNVEVCDPVNKPQPFLRGVPVVDFVFPSYYRPGSAGPWDQARFLKGNYTAR